MVTYVLARFFAEVWMFSDQTEAELLGAGWKKGPRTD